MALPCGAARRATAGSSSCARRRRWAFRCPTRSCRAPCLTRPWFQSATPCPTSRTRCCRTACPRWRRTDPRRLANAACTRTRPEKWSRTRRRRMTLCARTPTRLRSTSAAVCPPRCRTLMRRRLVRRRCSAHFRCHRHTRSRPLRGRQRSWTTPTLARRPPRPLMHSWRRCRLLMPLVAWRPLRLSATARLVSTTLLALPPGVGRTTRSRRRRARTVAASWVPLTRTATARARLRTRRVSWAAGVRRRQSITRGGRCRTTRCTSTSRTRRCRQRTRKRGTRVWHTQRCHSMRLLLVPAPRMQQQWRASLWRRMTTPAAQELVRAPVRLLWTPSPTRRPWWSRRRRQTRALWRSSGRRARMACLRRSGGRVPRPRLALGRSGCCRSGRRRRSASLWSCSSSTDATGARWCS
mmetsp:Transcript_16029/g.55964  ORF Transcript_16029/g.55964 Transcript_16029/m.55964 type:complete len:410 (+) Transcript_16029:747-1976(+)